MRSLLIIALALALSGCMTTSQHHAHFDCDNPEKRRIAFDYSCPVK